MYYHAQRNEIAEVNKTPNFANRTLFHGDNLPFLQSLNTGSVHLIYADPPFNKNKTFQSDPESMRAAGRNTGFVDKWRWDEDVQQTWVDDIKDDHPKLWQAIEAARVIAGNDMGAFLCWLSVRLIEMHRVLRDNGSIYLHLDHTAHAYAKSAMDAIFGRGYFRNSIAWNRNDGRGKGSQHAPKKWGANTDTILYYSKGDAPLKPWRELTPDEIESEFRHEDEDGRRFKWGIPFKLGRSDGPRPNLCFEWRGFPSPEYGWRLSIERMEEEYAKGNIVIDTSPSGKPRIRRRMFLDDYRGKPVDDFWSDIPRLIGGPNDKESVNYPTQKPLKLLHRIVAASSNPGDIVLDPFCGCATTPVAAEQLGRQWIGADLWEGAYDQVLNRLRSGGLAVPDEEWDGEVKQIRFSEVSFTKALPVRTDDRLVAVRAFRLRAQSPLAPWQMLSHHQIKSHLILAQTLSNDADGLVTCAGCGRQLEPEFMHLDHIQPKKGRGRNFIDNRILLCAPCNGKKGHVYTLDGLQLENAKPDKKGRRWMHHKADAQSAMTRALDRVMAVADGTIDHVPPGENDSEQVSLLASS